MNKLKPTKVVVGAVEHSTDVARIIKLYVQTAKLNSPFPHNRYFINIVNEITIYDYNGFFFN